MQPHEPKEILPRFMVIYFMMIWPWLNFMTSEDISIFAVMCHIIFTTIAVLAVALWAPKFVDSQEMVSDFKQFYIQLQPWEDDPQGFFRGVKTTNQFMSQDSGSHHAPGAGLVGLVGKNTAEILVETLYDIIYVIFICRDSIDITRYLANSCTSCWIWGENMGATVSYLWGHCNIEQHHRR